MKPSTHIYSTLIKEANIDCLLHLNNAAYLTLFEEARWDWITKNSYGLTEILERKQSPIILEVNIKFLKEVLLRDQIHISTELLSYEKKIGYILQKMFRGEQLCCEAKFTFALFDLTQRKIIPPTEAWNKALGLS